MESIVIFIIMLLIGSIFNSGKRKAANKEQEQPKPFTAGQKSQDTPIKKLKEMSRDLYKEIQQEFEVEQEKTRPRPEVTPQDLIAQVERKRQEVSVQQEQSIERKRSRETVRSNARVQSRSKQVSVKEKQLMPTSSDDIMKGIIFSEIIGPPKSKR